MDVDVESARRALQKARRKIRQQVREDLRKLATALQSGVMRRTAKVDPELIADAEVRALEQQS